MLELRCGFVLFTTQDEPYFSLTKVAVESLIEFSKYEVMVVGINCEIPWEYSRMQTNSIVLDPINYETICYAKTTASLMSPFDVSLQMDADMIASPDIDLLFKEINQFSVFPHGSLHPADPANQLPLMKLLGVPSKSQPYVHATYLFSKASLGFLAEVREIENWILKRRFLGLGLKPVNFDETILNVVLWKHDAYDAFVPTFDPYVNLFLNPRTHRTGKEVLGYPVRRYIAHGQKCPSCARAIFLEMAELNVGGYWHQNTLLDEANVAHKSFHSD